MHHEAIKQLVYLMHDSKWNMNVGHYYHDIFDYFELYWDGENRVPLLSMDREKTLEEFETAAARILEDYRWRRENRETRVLYTGQRCRSEFVMRDFEGWPEFAVEYNGGYHEDGQQADRDEFKRRILNEVGLPLRVMGRQDLQVADVD